MSTVEIYIKDGSDPVNVKSGFNWTAFFFPGIWAFWKGLYLAGWIGIGVPILSGFVSFSNDDASWVIVIVGLFMGIIYGASGNEWVVKMLRAEGYMPKYHNSESPSVNSAIQAEEHPPYAASEHHGGCDTIKTEKHSNQNLLIIAALASAILIATLWMLRFDVISSGSKPYVWVVDRWAGEILFCNPQGYKGSCKTVR